MREMNLKSYLLGTSSEPERVAIDRRLLTNQAEFEQVLLAEDELIDAYVRQELSAVERRQFEQCFLADPERQQKLRLALALHRYANDPAKISPGKVKAAAVSATDSWWAVWRRPVWQGATACAVLVVALLGFRAFLNSAESTQIAHSPSPATTMTPTTTPSGNAYLSVELFPGQTRDIKTKLKEIQLTPGQDTVQFKLLLNLKTYPTYEVTLQPDDEEGKKLTGTFQPQITAEGNHLSVRVPVSLLENGDCRIKLGGVTPQGTEKAETYAFTVKR